MIVNPPGLRLSGFAKGRDPEGAPARYGYGRRDSRRVWRLPTFENRADFWASGGWLLNLWISASRRRCGGCPFAATIFQGKRRAATSGTGTLEERTDCRTAWNGLASRARLLRGTRSDAARGRSVASGLEVCPGWGDLLPRDRRSAPVRRTLVTGIQRSRPCGGDLLPRDPRSPRAGKG